MLVAVTRLALGVHYLSDVVAGAFFGAVWLAIALRTHEAWHSDRGLSPTEPLRDGLEPEAFGDRNAACLAR